MRQHERISQLIYDTGPTVKAVRVSEGIVELTVADQCFEVGLPSLEKLALAVAASIAALKKPLERDPRD